MQHEYCDEGVRSKNLTERRKPTKVLKIAESFTNLDENAKAGRFVRGPHSRSGKRYREDGRNKQSGLCSGVENGCDSECASVCGTGDRSVTGSSCTALRTAVAALYPFDDFILEKIGSGFFSEVFKVRHKTTGKVMVLKMNQQRANRPNMLREVQLMNKLKHPNILKFMGVCVHEGQLHALTEYMEGGSLESLILSQEELSQRTKAALAMDIADGLNYLHSCGVFHRDLTSKNVLLRKNGEKDYTAVVADFGLAAKIPDADGCRLPTAGSPWWMSPECLRARFYDQRSDVFSFGVLLCQLLARVDADPDVLPRTDSFGLHYTAFVRLLPPHTAPQLLRLAFHCCIYSPDARPLFPEIIRRLTSIQTSLDDHARHPLNHHSSCEELESGPLSCPPQAMLPAYPEVRNIYNLHTDSPRRRSLSEVSWSSGRSSAPPAELPGIRRPLPAPARSACCLPPAPCSLLREAEIMLLLDPHASPHPPRNPFQPGVRGVKIFEPHSSDDFSSCVDSRVYPAQLAAALPARAPAAGPEPAGNKYNIPLHKSNSSGDLSESHLKAGSRRRGSCESGIFSVGAGECCPRHPGGLGAVCPCCLLGCARCGWGARADHTRLNVCEPCGAIYYRQLDPRRHRPDDSALSATTVSSLRSLDELDEVEPPKQASEAWLLSPFLCGKLSDSDAGSDPGDPEHKEYHILDRCCCELRSCGGLAGWGPSTSSVYTDSSDDIASLTGSDSYCDERTPAHRSDQIAKIVEYFERKGADFKCDRNRLAARGGERHRRGGARGEQHRLMVCEGAVRSKLPLFDKKS